MLRKCAADEKEPCLQQSITSLQLQPTSSIPGSFCGAQVELIEKAV
ncbi:MAG: hypothetical protein HY788_11175 [Deltaproteobacteria bacterium]|nr:hypothetical protein [Deltaproteobacteria bacterium]